MGNDTGAKYNIAELRGKYPNIGKKWQAEEDAKLKTLYEQKRAGGFGNFEEFVLGLVKEFGRAPGGIKARLAMHFLDVPGWDYERDRFRHEELDKKALEAIPEEKNDWLKQEYEKYLAEKKITYIKFLKRAGELLGSVEGSYITHRLRQLIGPVTKYTRGDLAGRLRRQREEAEQNGQEILQADFSRNEQAKEALRLLLETSHNVFLTGEAGTGKSTLLKYFRAKTDKNVVVLAPTGVAALNVEGQTIHSFCNFGPDITLSKVKKLMPGSAKLELLKKLQTVVIDEISMVRADLLDCMDKFLRLNGPVPSEPFGGLQMVFIGDLYQLPPVEKGFNGEGMLVQKYTSPYFFHSKAFEASRFNSINLQTVYRQKDPLFLEVLNAVRNNSVAAEHLQILNNRSATAGVKFTFEQYAIYLTPTNHRARQVNNFFLEKLDASLKNYTGTVRGNFRDRELPTDLELRVKIGAQVMMLNNDMRKRWVNGTMGKVVEFSRGGYDLDGEEDPASADRVIIELETGEKVWVGPHTWEMFQFILDKRTETVDSRSTGSFTQYPFKLAWAVTIHKAQGKTFNKVYVDLTTGAFAHGQLYVALSRCRTLEGLYLKTPIKPSDIILDPRVMEFMKKSNFKDNQNLVFE